MTTTQRDALGLGESTGGGSQGATSTGTGMLTPAASTVSSSCQAQNGAEAKLKHARGHSKPRSQLLLEHFRERGGPPGMTGM